MAGERPTKDDAVEEAIWGIKMKPKDAQLLSSSGKRAQDRRRGKSGDAAAGASAGASAGAAGQGQQGTQGGSSERQN